MNKNLQKFNKAIIHNDGNTYRVGITGVINLKQFLSILKSKFYNGCISVEPFNKEIYNMEENKKLIAVSNSLLNTFNLV